MRTRAASRREAAARKIAKQWRSYAARDPITLQHIPRQMRFALVEPCGAQQLFDVRSLCKCLFATTGVYHPVSRRPMLDIEIWRLRKHCLTQGLVDQATRLESLACIQTELRERNSVCSFLSQELRTVAQQLARALADPNAQIHADEFLPLFECYMDFKQASPSDCEEHAAFLAKDYPCLEPYLSKLDACIVAII